MLRIIGLVLAITLRSSTVDGFAFDLGCGCAPPPPPPCAPPLPPPPLLQLPNFAICPAPPVCPILAPPPTLPPLPPPPPLIASPCNPFGLWALPPPPRFAATGGYAQPPPPPPFMTAPAPNGYAQAPQPVQSPGPPPAGPPPPGPPPPGPPPVSGYSVAAHPAFLFITPDQAPQQMPPIPPPVTFDSPANTSRTRFSLAARAATTKKQQDGNVIVTENCSNEQLRQLIVDNNDGIMASSKQIIQAIAETKFGGRFDVFCSKGDFSYTANTQLYCQAERNGFSCLAYQQLS